jgi:hypothetical protein
MGRVVGIELRLVLAGSERSEVERRRRRRARGGMKIYSGPVGAGMGQLKMDETPFEGYRRVQYSNSLITITTGGDRLYHVGSAKRTN